MKNNINKNQTVYACGIEYDDFDEGGFAIEAICDSIEKANKIVQKNVGCLSKRATH